MADIKLAEKVYVGAQGRQTQDEVPLGFMVPYVDDPAGAKRRATVDKWAAGGGYGANKTFNAVILDNKPMIGFRIGRAVHRSGGWNGNGATYIRIEDPRGFELEISVENLIEVNQTTIMEKGEILHECVWMTTGTRNILVPINSELYLNAEIIKSAAPPIDLKDLVVGSKIKIQGDNRTGIYCGTMAFIESDRWQSTCTDLEDNGDTVGKSKKHVVAFENGDRHDYWGYPAFQVTELLEAPQKPLTALEVETMVLEDHKKGAVFKYRTANGTDTVKLWFNGTRKTKKENFAMKPVAAKSPLMAYAESLRFGSSLASSQIFVELADGVFETVWETTTPHNYGEYFYAWRTHTKREPGRVLVTKKYNHTWVDASEVKGYFIKTYEFTTSNGLTFEIIA